MATNEQREALQTRVAELLSTCDDSTLLKIERMLRSTPDTRPEKTPPSQGGLTRRQLLAPAATGGAVVVSTNAATGVLAGALGLKVGETKTQLANQAELIKLRGLLLLYESLEQVGIDAILSAGIAALRISLDGLQLGISALRSGVSLVDAGVSTFEGTFPAIRRGLSLAERLVAAVENRLTQLQGLMSQVTEIVSPLSDALGTFFSSLVARIPGIGQAILDTLDRISELVGSLPQAMGEINSELLQPLREDWFTDDEDEGLKGRLLNPLQENLLVPLESLLDDLTKATEDWEKQLISPVEQALSKREVIRKQIAQYKEREGLS